METIHVVASLSALAHQGRLSTFRLLVRTGSDGMAAGEIARQLGALPNTLSANLGILHRAGLVRSQRRGRSIVYAAEYHHMTEVLSFLMEDCCAGSPEICAPLAAIAVRSQCAPSDRA